MELPRITSPDNPLLRQLRLVASGARRAPSDLVVCEGVRVLEEATQAAAEVVAAVVDEEFGSTEREAALLDRWNAARIRTVRVPRRLLRAVSGVQSPQGAAALVRLRRTALAEVPLHPNALVACACGVQDPGNLGSMVRTAAAAGATLFCTTEGTVSLRNPKTVRASAGALFRLPQVEGLRPAEFLEYCRERSIAPYLTSPAAGRSYEAHDLSARCAFVLGSEGHGLEADAWRGTPRIRIPMAAGIESLNVAAAAAVLLMEALRQRRAALAAIPKEAP